MFNKDVELRSIETIRGSLLNLVEAMPDRDAVALYRIVSEHGAAINKHERGFSSAHEGYAVLLEELDEAWDAIKQDDHDHAAHEISQVGAMAMRYLIDLSPPPAFMENG